MSKTSSAPPISLGGFFDESDDSEDERSSDAAATKFEQIYEEQLLEVGDATLYIRQFSWHQANGNQVWPGTFKLATFIGEHRRHFSNGLILELGAATGALAIYLSAPPRNYKVITSDIDDGGCVEENIRYNFSRNNQTPVPHVPWTWGTPMDVAFSKLTMPIPEINSSEGEGAQCSVQPRVIGCIKYIVASDILLYVSAYPALVETLCALFEGGSVEEFLMSWQRRIDESKIFFELIASNGFKCEVLGGGIYSFTKLLPAEAIVGGDHSEA